MTERATRHDESRVLELLSTGEIEVHGLIPYASNATLLVTVDDGGLASHAVYKPRSGERALWDFPDDTLAQREVAAWVLDAALGFKRVPPTVLRADAPHGIGSLQLWIDPDPDVDLRALGRTHPADLFELALFDALANNADRKVGHCLVDDDGKLWGIDHGICFHTEPKLRTVLWLFEGDPIPAHLLEAVDRVRNDDAALESLAGLLDGAEVDALRDRATDLLQSGHMPVRRSDHDVPWPPW